MYSLWAAFGFLTRVPVGDPSKGGSRPVEISGAAPWFPVVGAVVGCLHGALWWALAGVAPPFVAAALSVAATLLVTGAFHHDGLADMADAFGGGWNVEQRLEIMRDSRLGTYGTASLSMALLIEVGSLASLAPELGAAAVAIAHVVGRALAVVTMKVARLGGDGLGASYARDLSLVGVVAAGVFCVGWVAAVVIAFDAIAVAPALVGAGLAAAAAAAVVALAYRKIGGITGDVLGAVVVVAFVAVMVAVAGAASA